MTPCKRSSDNRVLFARRGENVRAVAHLTSIRHTLLRHGLVEEAGLFGLEAVQALVNLGDANDAEMLARQIIREFSNANLNTRAISALGYLTEAVAARTASAA